MSDSPTPVGLQRISDSAIRIAWSDGQSRDYRAGELREACPCATCREKKSAPPPPANLLPVLSAAEAQPLAITGMKPAGSYAYNISFSDGHSSGLFTFERLLGLGSEADSTPSAPGSAGGSNA